MRIFKKNQLRDVMITVRYSGERTLEVCCEIIRNSCPEIPLSVVEEYPFKKSLESCYRLALEQSDEKKWLITVDADMIIEADALKEMVGVATSMPDHYFQLQGMIADKVTGLIKRGGPRCYRISYLKEALEILDWQATELRPEHHVIHNMGERGYPSRYTNQVLCFHDYEQYYSDLFRKSFIHAKKHRELTDRIRKRATELAKEDDDYKIILEGVEAGTSADDCEAVIDARMLKEEAGIAMKKAGVKEKGALAYEEFSKEKILSEWLMSTELQNKKGRYYDEPDPINSAKAYEKVKIVVERYGLLRGSGILGSALIHKLSSLVR